MFVLLCAKAISELLGLNHSSVQIMEVIVNFIANTALIGIKREKTNKWQSQYIVFETTRGKLFSIVSTGVLKKAQAYTQSCNFLFQFL